VQPVKAFIVFLLAFGTCRLSFGQSDDQEMLKKLNQEWLNSIISRDTVALGNILADDFVMITPAGTKNSKKDNLETAASRSVRVSSVTIDSVDIRLISNDLGIVTAWTHFVFNVDSKETRGRNCYQDIYQKRNGKWVAIAAHVTLLGSE
jgi:uncharacterized protein (TIGR02246 family)